MKQNFGEQQSTILLNGLKRKKQEVSKTIKWSNVYLEQIEKCGGINKYTDIKLKQKRKLLNIIRKFSGDGKIIEAGCGTGIVSSKLVSEGYCATAIDIDNEVLDFAKRVAIENYGKIITNYKIDSIFDLDYGKDEFDLCFSVGVLEHFNDEKIVYLQKLKNVIYTLFKDTKVGLIHGDLHFNNVLLNNRNEIVLIDFENIEKSFIEKEFDPISRMSRNPNSFNSNSKIQLNSSNFNEFHKK